MYKFLIAAAAVGILLLAVGTSFSHTNSPQSNNPQLPINLPTNGTPYNIVSESGAQVGRACAYKWYSEDRKSYLLLVATYQNTGKDQQREMLLQVGDASNERHAPANTLRLTNKAQINGLLSTLKYEVDMVRNAHTKGISVNATNDCSESDDCIESSIGVSVSEAGSSSASIDLSNETGSCIFTFSPKEQYIDFVAKYEVLNRWLDKQQ